MVLAQDEIDACREAFLAFDKDRCVFMGPEWFWCFPYTPVECRSGTIDVWELRQVLEGGAIACGMLLETPVSHCCVNVGQPWASSRRRRNCSR
jgi:hypothetical protein